MATDDEKKKSITTSTIVSLSLRDVIGITAALFAGVAWISVRDARQADRIVQNQVHIKENQETIKTLVLQTGILRDKVRNLENQ